ncbi:YdcF family protein [Dokdonella ginsengisoli]|uniref:YdcF family protein n=1 Tax=Dokdonella ginsengisoli TaxID=363846 RepID=A0ABV9QRL5_9GAMM
MIDFLLSPLTWLLASFALLLVLPRRRLPRRLAAALAVLAVVATTPLGANALVWMVELAPDDAASCHGPAPAIVVLGGGFERDPADERDVAALSGTGLRRLLAAAALHEHNRDARLYIAGAADDDGIPESVVMATLAQRLGVPADAVSTERTSMTTWENAQNLRALPQPPPVRIALVTSALHLPRALAAFRAAGFEPCAIASDSVYVPPQDLGYFLPRASALRKADDAIHEIVGSLWYRWLALRAGS